MKLLEQTTDKPRVPMIFARLSTCEGQKPEPKTIRVLLDSGASATLIEGSLVERLRQRAMPEVSWCTRGGTFNTTAKTTIHFTMPELSESKMITWSAYVDNSPNDDLSYDMIIGRDLLRELEVTLDFGSETVSWQGSDVPMKPQGAT